MARVRNADEEGLQVRPGGPLVPRLRRLRDPQGCVQTARARSSAGPRRRTRVRDLGHRLLEPLPVLHEHVRLPLDPRPRAGDRDRHQAGQPRPVRLDRDGRRRRAVDRRQPPDPHAAPQRRHQGLALQQRDLRVDEGAVLADVADGPARRRRRPTARSTPLRSDRAGPRMPAPPSWRARSTTHQKHMERVFKPRPPTRARPSSRSSRTA